MKITSLFALILCFLPARAHAEGDGPQPVPGYPGWTLELVQPEEGSVTYRQPYFALKPPDKRPLASITHQAAEQLQNGELGPEAVYAGGSADANASAEKKDTQSGVSSISSTFGANNNNLPAGRSPAAIPSLYKAPTSADAPAAEPAPAVTTAASAAPGATNSSGASSSPSSDASGERAPASLAANNAKATADFQVGAVGKGASTTTAAAATTSAVVHACGGPEDCQRVAGANHLLGAFDGRGYPDVGPGLGYDGNSLANNAAYICSKVGKSTVVSSASTGMPFYTATPLSFCTSGRGCADGYVSRYELVTAGPTYKVVSSVDCK